jgi:predicted nucleic acid-binding protein
VYSAVIIPETVQKELLASGAPDVVRRWAADTPHWVRVERVAEDRLNGISDGLGLGERHAIAIARQRSSSLLIVDDKQARLEATRYRLAVVGTIGVVAAAALLELLDFDEVIGRLSQTSMYLSDSVIRAARGRVVTEVEHSQH